MLRDSSVDHVDGARMLAVQSPGDWLEILPQPMQCRQRNGHTQTVRVRDKTIAADGHHG